MTGKTIIIGCTILPGYIRNVASKILPNNKIVYNPSFIAQGEILNGLNNPDVILIGCDDDDTRAKIRDYYGSVLDYGWDRIHAMDSLSSEIAKLSLNCYITTKISFANMVGHLANTVGANPEAILNCIGNDRRVGNKCLKYGYGYAGPCFPRDNKALSTYMRSVNLNPVISEATDRFNNLYVDLVAKDLEDDVKNHSLYHPTVIAKENKITVKGINYKPDCKLVMLDESFGLKVAINLNKLGWHIVLEDRADVLEEAKRLYGDKFEYVAV